MRPFLGKPTTYTGYRIRYDNDDLGRAIGLMLEADGCGRAYEFDLVNLTRQWLGNKSTGIYERWLDAYGRRDLDGMRSAADSMLELIDDMDALTGTQSFFLAGKWISDARAWGSDRMDGSYGYFERNARNILTTWSDAGMTLNDYAIREWNGILGTYSRHRWESFFTAAEEGVRSGSDAWYERWLPQVKAFERAWGENLQGSFASEPSGDPIQTATDLYVKWL